MAMVERKGRIVAKVVPNARTVSLRPIVLEHVEPGSIVLTDELRSYGLLTKDGYRHGRVNHAQKEYARYVCKSLTFHTNTVEGFWRLLKASIRSTHVSVSSKKLQNYVNEFAFRVNHREQVNRMFDVLVAAL
jgi:transposase-like protein